MKCIKLLCFPFLRFQGERGPPYTILAPNVAIIFGISERSEEEFLFLSSSEFYRYVNFACYA